MTNSERTGYNKMISIFHHFISEIFPVNHSIIALMIGVLLFQPDYLL